MKMHLRPYCIQLTNCLPCETIVNSEHIVVYLDKPNCILNVAQMLEEASCGCPKYANDVYMNIHNPNPNPNPKSLTPPLTLISILGTSA